MSSLLISINASASKKNGFIILETYYTKKITINKSGKYTGSSISPVNVMDNIPVDNCDHKKISMVFGQLCTQLSPNSFYIDLNSFRKLVGELSGIDNVFIDNPDRSLYIIREILNSEQQCKAKYQYRISGIEFKYYINYGLYITENSIDKTNIKVIDPMTDIYYSYEDKKYKLYFLYNKEKVLFSDKTASIFSDGTIYVRNYVYEKKAYKKLINNGFIKLSGSNFLYSGKKNIKEIKDNLKKEGVTVYDDDTSVLPDIRIKKGEHGWFDIDITCNINGEIIDLASKIDLFASDYYTLNGQKIFLPDSILNAKNDMVYIDNKLRINQSNIVKLMRLIYDSGESEDVFFSYSNVQLELDPQIVEIAYPYQLQGIKWMKFLILNNLGGCLADDMGLGKTFQIIGLLSDKEIKKRFGKVLIIVPKSLLINWKREFEKFNSSYVVGIYHGEKRSAFDFDHYDIILTTYATAFSDIAILNKNKYAITIFDEVQYVKNYKSKTSTAMKLLNSEIRLGLSGTPMENNISELWNIMDLLNPGVFSSHTSFMRRYGDRNYNELKFILSLFILRRMKKDVLRELPPKTEKIIYCDMDTKQRNLYISITIAVREAIMNLKAFSAPVVLKGLNMLRECCCHPLLLNEGINKDRIEDSCKIDTLKILVNNLLEYDHKILIFSNYVSMLNIIKEELKKNIKRMDKFFYLDGKTKNRAEVVAEFEASSSGVFFISIKAGGLGLNLTSAQDVIIYDPWWNPFVEQQAVDRAYRIGQKNPVTVYKLIAANTLEEKILDMQKNKENIFNELINDVSIDKNIKLDEILKLL